MLPLTALGWRGEAVEADHYRAALAPTLAKYYPLDIMETGVCADRWRDVLGPGARVLMTQGGCAATPRISRFRRDRHPVFLGRQNGFSVLGTRCSGLCFGRGHPGVCRGTTSFPTSLAASGMAARVVDGRVCMVESAPGTLQLVRDRHGRKMSKSVGALTRSARPFALAATPTYPITVPCRQRHRSIGCGAWLLAAITSR